MQKREQHIQNVHASINLFKHVRYETTDLMRFYCLSLELRTVVEICTAKIKFDVLHWILLPHAIIYLHNIDIHTTILQPAQDYVIIYLALDTLLHSSANLRFAVVVPLLRIQKFFTYETIQITNLDTMQQFVRNSEL